MKAEAITNENPLHADAIIIDKKFKEETLASVVTMLLTIVLA